MTGQTIVKAETITPRSESTVITNGINDLVANICEKHRQLNMITGLNVDLKTSVIDNILWVTFSKNSLSKSVRIPLSSTNDKGLELIHNNGIARIVCNYWLEKEQLELNYYGVIDRLICSNVNDIMPNIENRSPIISKIVKSFEKNTTSFMINSLQRLINEIVNKMPLYETDMNSWVMNRRLVIIDDVFESLSDPNMKLEYQVLKNQKYYSMFGWTSIGLSEGTLADKNTILKVDLRKFTPFGMYHNPQRNLYSTLGMKGDELPRVRSQSMQDLIDKHISRKGWNLTTCIIDLPLNFEDQILVDNRHKGLFTTVERKYQLYGEDVKVKTNDTIKTGDTLGISGDKTPLIMSMKCDEAKVTRVKKELSDLDGNQTMISIITVIGKRYLRDGSKFSNLHGNKGIIKFMDLGYAVNPKTAEEVPIDVIISGSSINKRANFGQILEMLSNNTISGDDAIVINDDYKTEICNVEDRLEKEGFPRDGTWVINTYCGEFSAVTGRMFWGVTKDPQDQLWEGERTYISNNRTLRKSGLKFSHVELKALTTRFGKNNPIIKEILSYSQGTEILTDEIKILKSFIGKTNDSLPTIEAKSVKYVDTSENMLHTIDEIKGTVVDEEFMSEGFVLKLPTEFQVIVNKKNPDEFICGMAQKVQNPQDKDVYQFDKIYIPNALLRRCWKHGSGKWGLNTIGALVNRIVEQCHRFENDSSVSIYTDLIRSITSYFLNVSKMMGTKKGEISLYGMSIRYPTSSHAIASLSMDLPENTIEIHTEMAKDLKVKNGDVVLIERFPCLGFMSVRPQLVKVTNDPQCKYVIRVSGNSLVSMGLDFDGDTLFIASFHTPKAKEILSREMKSPNEICKNAIDQMNSKKKPTTEEMCLSDFNVRVFERPTVEEHIELVRKATGVKSHTGPVISLAYNLMRIVEKNVPYENVEEHAHIELLLDFLGNTVFKQKHGIKSLQEEATDAICTADVDKMVKLGFDRKPSLLLCNLIIREAGRVGVVDLVKYHTQAKESGSSKIINLIVRMQNKVYFASRAQLGPINLLKHIEENDVDLPSYMFKTILKSERMLAAEKLGDDKLKRMERRFENKNNDLFGVYKKLATVIDRTINVQTTLNKI